MNQIQATIKNLANAAAVVALVGSNGNGIHDQNSNTGTVMNNHNKNQNYDIQLSEEIIRSAIGNHALNLNNGLLVELRNNQMNNIENENNMTQIGNTSSNNNSSSTSSLANQNTMLSDKRKLHNCPFCDRSFTRPYRLNDHISFSHTDERKYMCSLCSKNFSCKDKLKHHIDVKHDNKKPNSKSKTKLRNTEDLKCSSPGCTKMFANKYNVKRHMENVHLKMKRRHNNNNNTSKRSNSSNNSSSLSLNSSLNGTSTVTAPNANQQKKSSCSSTSTSSQSSSSNSISTAIATVASGFNDQHMPSTPTVTKMEPMTASTPILNQSKNTSKINTNKNQINQNLLTGQMSNTIINNQINSNTNNNNNNTPLTLVATSNGIGGITLTALGSIHQQHQQHLQQNSSSAAAAVAAALGLTPITNNLNGNLGSNIITLNAGGNNSQNNSLNNTVINTNQSLPILINNNSNNNSYASLNNQFNQQQQHQQHNHQLNQSNHSKNFNAVAVAAAAELVNSLLKSEQHQSQQHTNFNQNHNQLLNDNNSHGLISFSTQLDQQTNQTIQQQQNMYELQQQDQQMEDEKDAKIYTCARCPEIFNSSNLLRKHVSESHEKEYECCICNLNFTNRFSWLKHKNFHSGSVSVNSTTTSITETSNEDDRLIDDNSNNEPNGIDSNANFYDINTMYKRSLVNCDSLVDMNIPLSSYSVLAINNKKAKQIANGSLNSKEEQDSIFLNLINENSCCDICRKCISQKKKLVAHRRICLMKFKNKHESKTNGTG